MSSLGGDGKDVVAIVARIDVQGKIAASMAVRRSRRS